MAQMSFIFVCVFVVVISFSEATPFGMFPKMAMPGFQQMGMPGFGLHDMMQMMMFPTMQPKPFQVTAPKDINKLREQMRLQQLKIEAQHKKMMLEHQKMMEAAMMNHFATLAPKPLVETKPKSKSSKSKSKSSKSMNSDTSARSKSKSDVNSKEIKLSMPSKMPLTMPGQMPLTAGMPGSNFQSMSYSTSSHSAHVNGVPVTASQTGQVTVNDNGKVTTHVF
uniref:Uncharacterized protein n=1 Tax=Nilaparvata lugens TaxID=108931 RepID=A0A220XIG9_NILLU|nr:hypothetical protein [Nilaparvata lugens]